MKLKNLENHNVPELNQSSISYADDDGNIPHNFENIQSLSESPETLMDSKKTSPSKEEATKMISPRDITYEDENSDEDFD